MMGFHPLVRRVLVAALGLAPVLAWAQTEVRYENEIVVVTGLAQEDHRRLEANPEKIILQVAGLGSDRGMPITVELAGDDLYVKPRFALLAGTKYALLLDDGTEFTVQAPASEAPVPKLVKFEPSQAIVPANLLRMYLQFSEPMARGQLRDEISLKRDDGSSVPSPFLTLGPELWDPKQTRLTLLFDPGRIKQGVGPNAQVGAPLEEGQQYRLIVGAKMESAAGKQLGEDISLVLRVGPAERRPLEPEKWQILVPSAGNQAPLTVAFDRIVDTGAAKRLIKVFDPDGKSVSGRIESDGGGWSLVPSRPWREGVHNLVIDPELEDFSGNTLGAPFDANVGTIGEVQEPVTLSVIVSGKDD